MLLGGGGTKSLKGARREGEIPRDLAPKGENPRDLAPGGGGARSRRGEIPGTPATFRVSGRKH